MTQEKRISDDPICARVDALLTQMGASRCALARAIGVVPTTFNARMKGMGGRMDAKHIAPMADFLGVSIHYLLTGEDDWVGLAAESFLEARRSLQAAAAQLHRCQGLYLDEAV